MNSGNQIIDSSQKCELCEQKMNPAVKIYNNIRLCKACFHHMEKLPDVVAKSVERFLIGNVVWAFETLIYIVQAPESKFYALIALQIV